MPFSNIHKSFLLAAFILAHVTGCSDTKVTNDAPIEVGEQSEIEIRVGELVNAYRDSQDLAPLEMNGFISEVAREHSQNMADGTTEFGHGGFNERVAKIREELGGNAASENVAAGYRSAEAAVEGWINSDGHRNNIEGNYTLTGVGVAYSDDGTPYYTQIFLEE